MLSVPLLVVCGLPVLSAPAAAQAQSVVIAAIGTAGYVLHGSVDPPAHDHADQLRHPDPTPCPHAGSSTRS
jgi:hypothetical protein